MEPWSYVHLSSSVQKLKNSSIVLKPLNSHEWPRQNFLLQYLNNQNQQVLKIKKNINNEISTWSNTKFSKVS